jgi:hypothetical protein
MSNTFIIQSKLADAYNNPLVVDIEEGGGSLPPKKNNAYLDAFTPTGNNNQLWTAVPDPAHSGYFFIQSMQPDSVGETLVIDIHGVNQKHADNMKDGTLLDAWTQDQVWYENQLWTIALDPATQPNTAQPTSSQRNFILIQSYLKNSSGVPFVIDIQGWSGANPSKGTALDAFHQKTKNTDNQLWTLNAQQKYPTPGITSLTPDYDITNPEATVLGVTGSGFPPGSTLALVLTGGDLTQGPPILTVTDFAGNFDMGARLVADWGYPGLGIEGPFSIAVFFNEVGIFGQPWIVSVNANWTGVGINEVVFNNA